MNMRVRKLSKKNCDSQKQTVMQLYLSKWVKRKDIKLIKFSLYDCTTGANDYAPGLTDLFFSWCSLSPTFAVSIKLLKPFYEIKTSSSPVLDMR